MKRRDLLSACLDAIQAWLMAMAGVGCLATGFDLWIEPGTVALVAAAAALLAVTIPRLRRGWILLVLTMLLGAQLLWELDLQGNLFSQLNHMLSAYDKAYGWGIPETLLEFEEKDATLTVSFLAASLTLLGGISLSNSWYAGALLAFVLPVAPCVVVTNTVPEAEFLWLGVVMICILTLTQYSRRTDTRQANRLTAMVLIPAVLASTLLFTQNPQAEYEAPDGKQGFFGLMQELAQHIPFMNKGPGSGGSVNSTVSSSQVDLTAAGPRTEFGGIAMEITADYTGVTYLRGRSFGAYTGKAWAAAPDTEALIPPDLNYTTQTNQTIYISMRQLYDLKYMPYYPGQYVTLQQGRFPNEAQKDYGWEFVPLRADWKYQWRQQHGTLMLYELPSIVKAQGLEDYLQLPAETRRLANYYLRRAGVGSQNMFVHAAVENIRNYVRSSAAYDLNTGYQPQDQDFAMWFLEAGETGYCVHFATAATVLLRAAGIPARYVEGYLVEAQAADSVEVGQGNAHAWVEYYLPNVGWVILEATPEDGLPVTLPPEPTAPPTTSVTKPTQPSQPTKPTVPSGPTVPPTTVPTVPTEPTLPTNPTNPTQPTQPTQPSTPETSTTPQETQPATRPIPDQDVEQPDRKGLERVLQWTGLLLAVLVALIVQWQLRLALRRRRMRGNSWAAVYRRWRYSCLLAKLCRHRPPAALEALVKKAKFSQHTLSHRELRCFDRYDAACILGLKKLPWTQRMLCRLVLAAW